MSLQRVANFARKVFTELDNPRDLTKNINALATLVNNISINDISFDKKILSENAQFDSSRHEAPIGYVYLWDSPIFSMGIFIIRKGEKIPLHNHPGMHGILKVIHGQAEINSFSKICDDGYTIPESVKNSVNSWDTSNISAVLQHDSVAVDAKSEPCILGPTSHNIHEIKATYGTTAFFDILGPPYDEERICEYYKLLDNISSDINTLYSADSGSTPVRYILKTHQPHNFFCQPIQYRGPQIHDPLESEDSASE